MINKWEVEKGNRAIKDVERFSIVQRDGMETEWLSLPTLSLLLVY